MILVTGGAGFIGSNLVATLLERGYKDVTVCDRLRDGDKWRNLRKHGFAGVVMPENLMSYLERHQDEIDIIFHLGAISSTTETDVDKIFNTNFALSLDLWKWAAQHGKRFIYASSAATYGDGTQGFKDDGSFEYLTALRPLNPYGWSKNMFDIRVCREVEKHNHIPAQWAGLKFFNVYGPNEFHKHSQRSVMCQMQPHAAKGLHVKLFRSLKPGVAHGEQMRDFVYVKDCCDVMIWLMENPKVNGLFNVGSGKARSFNDMASAVFKAVGIAQPRIDYIDLPPEIANKYQYFTEADLTHLRAVGYTKPMTSLEDGAVDYIQNYLNHEDPYR